MPSKKSKQPAPPQTIHSPALDKLNLRERTFVQAIATLDSPTFSNGAQSAILAKYADNPLSGARAAWSLKRKPDISTAIDEVFKKNNLSIEVRARVMSDILAKETTVIENLDADGNLISQTRMSNDKMRLAVIREASKVDGTYSRSEAIGRAQGKLLEPILEDYTRRLRAELREAPKEPVTMDETQVVEHAEIVDSVAPDAQAQGTDASTGDAHTEISGR